MIDEAADNPSYFLEDGDYIALFVHEEAEYFVAWERQVAGGDKGQAREAYDHL